MDFYPLNLRMAGKLALVVGGGEVALRKVEGLLEAGAKVRLVSPSIHPGLQKLAKSSKNLFLEERGYDDRDVENVSLVFACTDDERLNGRVCEMGRSVGALVQSASDPADCDFTVPSKIRRGEFLLAISTGGASPALSKKIRERLEKTFPPAYGDYVQLLARVREKLLQDGKPAAENSPKFRKLVEGKLEEAVLKGKSKEIERVLTNSLGKDYSLTALGFKKADGRQTKKKKKSR